MLKNANFVASLHGLRGIAVLYVVASHIGNGGMGLLPLPLNAIGKVGVWIFFGLSAFLLTSKLREQWQIDPRWATLGRYLIHRFFRIFPLFAVVLILHVVLDGMTWGTLARHLLLIEGQGELWAISTEFQFYLLLPLLAVLPRAAALGALIAALVACIAYGILNPADVFSNGLLILPKAAPFILAATFAVVMPAVRFQTAIGLAGAVVLLTGTWYYRHLHVGHMVEWVKPWLSLTIAASVALLIASATRPGPVAAFLSNRVLVWIGEVSFSIYLLHMFVLWRVMPMGLNPYVGGWLALGLVLILAAVSYRLIEEPGIRLGRAVASRLGARRAHPLPSG